MGSIYTNKKVRKIRVVESGRYFALRVPSGVGSSLNKRVTHNFTVKIIDFMKNLIEFVPSCAWSKTDEEAGFVRISRRAPTIRA